MSDPLPSSAGDIPPGSGQEPAVPSPGRVLQMRPSESVPLPDTLDERLTEVIEEVQNSDADWERLQSRVSARWQEISAQARSLLEDLAAKSRNLSQERPLVVVATVALTAFFVGAALRATRSRYE